MGYFNLPWFSWGSPETSLGDTLVYNTLVRVTSPYDRLATAVVKLFVHYNVRTTGYFSIVRVASQTRRNCFFSQFTPPGDVDIDETRQFSGVDVTRGDNRPDVNVVYLNR